MTVMLVVLAVWAAISLVMGLTVGRAIRQADSAEFPARRAEWWVRPAATPAEADGEPTGADQPTQVPHAA